MNYYLAYNQKFNLNCSTFQHFKRTHIERPMQFDCNEQSIILGLISLEYFKDKKD